MMITTANITSNCESGIPFITCSGPASAFAARGSADKKAAHDICYSIAQGFGMNSCSNSLTA
jgi:hypothetical protein